MELKIGEYTIPEGCTIKRIGNTIQVYQKKKQRDTSVLRCRDCKYCDENTNQWYHWYLCLAREWGKDHKRNYNIKPHFKACEKFERKEE